MGFVVNEHACSVPMSKLGAGVTQGVTTDEDNNSVKDNQPKAKLPMKRKRCKGYENIDYDSDNREAPDREGHTDTPATSGLNKHGRPGYLTMTGPSHKYKGYENAQFSISTTNGHAKAKQDNQENQVSNAKSRTGGYELMQRPGKDNTGYENTGYFSDN